MNKNYVPSRGPFGIVANLSYHPNPEKKVSGFCNADYQVTFANVFCYTGDCNVKYNFIQEITFGYGLQFRVGKQLKIFNNINLGRYREHLFSELLQKRIVFSGYNSLFRIGLKYDFFSR